MEHCWEYGFVLRYPNAKSEITGIIYEPWHYRYVGREAAREMTELDLCLEGIRRLALRPVSHRIYANDALDRYDVQALFCHGSSCSLPSGRAVIVAGPVEGDSPV